MNSLLLYFTLGLSSLDTCLLKAIGYVESNNNVSAKHSSDAFGSYGIRPILVRDLQNKFSELKGIPLDATTEHLYAEHNLQFLKSKYKKDDDVILAWLLGAYGISGIKSSEHWYVKKVKSAKRLFCNYNL